MTGATLVRAAAAIVVAWAALLPAARPASACDVSYHYKPDISFDRPGLGLGRVCTTSTSLAGAALFDLLAVSALVGAAAAAVRRGQASAAGLAGSIGVSDALPAYLAAASPAAPRPHAPGEPHAPAAP
jgi:hypothetical protein